MEHNRFSEQSVRPNSLSSDLQEGVSVMMVGAGFLLFFVLIMSFIMVQEQE